MLDRYWLLTWTTYGTRLPGDPRGSVTSVHDEPGPRRRHNLPGTEVDRAMPGLHRSAIGLLKGPPVYLLPEQAHVILGQFQETAQYRQWLLLAVAIMSNHCHVVLGVPGDPEPESLLRDLKSYASRALNRLWQRPEGGTWWTESGSKRKLPHQQAVVGAVHYVEDQDHPLLIRIHTDPASRGR